MSIFSEIFAVFRGRLHRPHVAPAARPAVTILKPVCGVEKGLEENLRSTCRQGWPELQVVLCVQEEHDPALPILLAVQREMGEEKVAVAVGGGRREPNGKIRNLLGALPRARHDVLFRAKWNAFGAAQAPAIPVVEWAGFDAPA